MSIANLNVKLTANIGAFASTMAAAAKPLAGFAGGVTSAATKLTGLVSGITALVGAGSLTVLVTQSMEAIDTNAKLSDRLGITTEALAGLQYAGDLAGVSSEELTGGLEKMLKALGGAADDGDLASNAFTKLGLNAKALANMPTDQAFASIATQIAAIQNPAERAAAVGVFGKSGQSLLPLMMSGAEGIKAAQAEAEKLGLTYSRIDAAKVEAANDSMTRMKSVVTGVGNQLAIAVSPFIDAAAAKLTEMASSGDGMGTKIVNAFEAVVGGIAYASDYLSLLKAGFKLLQAGATFAVYGVVKAVDLLGSSMVGLLNLLPGVELKWTDVSGQLADGLLQDAHRLTDEAGQAFASFQNGDNAKAVGNAFADIRAKSQAAAQATADNAAKMSGSFKDIEDSTANLKKVGDTLTDLKKQVGQFGLTDSQKKLADLTSMGASPEQIKEAESNLKRLDDMTAAQKKHDDLQGKSKTLIESMQTPLQKYESTIDDLNQMLGGGMLSWDQYGQAVRNARSELEKSDAAKADTLVPQASVSIRRASYVTPAAVNQPTKDVKSAVDKNTDAIGKKLDKLIAAFGDPQALLMSIVGGKA